MKVTRIGRIKGHRVFRDFAWPADLQPFGQFNLIYGWNGSGKTTLSSLLRRLENRSVVTEGEVEFEVDGATKVAGTDLATASLPPVRVFNRDFTEATVLAAGERMEPIYYLGEDSVEKQKEVEILRKEYERAKAEVATAESKRATAAGTLDDFCVNRARVIKELLISSRTTSYNNYDKRRFRQVIERLTEESRTKALLRDEEKERLRRQKDAQPKSMLATVSVSVPAIGEIATTVEAILKRPVTSQLIQELTEDREVGVWVQRGLYLHSGERETATCRFCQQALTAERRGALEGHFSDTFSALQSDIAATEQLIEGHRSNLVGVEFPDSSRLYDHLATDFESAVTVSRSLLSEASTFLRSLHEALLKKKEYPFEVVAWPDPDRDTPLPERASLIQAIASVNAIIETHNKTTTEFQSELGKASQKLEQCYVAEALPEYDQLRNAVEDADDAQRAVADKPKLLQGQIASIERAIVEHRKPAEELNLELHAYLGHDELRFEIKETGYTIVRAGQPANHLSEGEKTAIAFLYFLKSLQDRAFDLANGIVVIDDPVSSLDANSLFSAFASMKERTKGAGQLFVLTHNFGFFRQVKNWFHHLPKQNSSHLDRRPARFYLLRAYVREGQRVALLGPLDPLLEQYESEYHYLFKTVHEEAQRPDEEVELRQYYGMPNIARRLLEAFLTFRYPDSADDLSKRLDLVAFDADKKTRILRLLHTYSHGTSIVDAEHDPTILSETRPVLRDVLALIESVDPAHYEGLTRLVNTPEPAE